MRPLEVLAHRDVLYRDLTMNQTFQSAFRRTHELREQSRFNNLARPDALLAVARSSIKMGETFLVTAEMNELAEAAQVNMPPEPFMPEDLPSTHGFMWIEGGVQTPDLRGALNSSSALTWSASDGGVVVITWAYKYDMKDAINVELHRDPDRLREAPNLIWTGYAGALKFGGLPMTQITSAEPIPVDAKVEWTADERLLVDGVETASREAGPNHETSWLLTAWRLMQQTLATTNREQVAAKRLRRFDLKDDSVSVITLRHRAPYHEGETHVEWRHRWVVRGHWRRQPYKDSDGATIYRWIYINPFLKGPEGAPLKRGEKINVWKQ